MKNGCFVISGRRPTTDEALVPLIRLYSVFIKDSEGKHSGLELADSCSGDPAGERSKSRSGLTIYFGENKAKITP